MRGWLPFWQPEKFDRSHAGGMTMTILSREALADAITTWPPKGDVEDSVRAELIVKGESWVTARPHLLHEPEQILHAAGMRKWEFKLFVHWHGKHLYFDQSDVQNLMRDE
jgi:hypothetical protein